MSTTHIKVTERLAPYFDIKNLTIGI